MKTRYIRLSIAILAFSLFSACSQDSLTDISQNWKIAYDDSISYADPEYDDSSWKPTDVPLHLAFRKGKEVLWLRKAISIPGNMDTNNIAIYLGKIHASDETYFNGVRIGKTGRHGKDYFSSWNRDRFYSIPPSLIKGTNILAIRAYSPADINVKSRFKLGSIRDIEFHTLKKQYIAQYVPASIGMLTLLMFVVTTIYFIRNRSRYGFHIAGISLLCSLLTIPYFATYYGISYHIIDRLQYIMISVFIMWIFIFIQIILDFHMKKSTIAVVLVSIAVSIILITSPIGITGWVSYATGLTGLIIEIMWGAAILLSLFRKKNIESKYLFISYVVFLICMVHDILYITGNIMADNFWNNFGYLAMIFGFVAIVMRRSSQILNQLQTSTEEIERKNTALSDILIRIRNSVAELNRFASIIKDSAEEVERIVTDQGARLEETASSAVQVEAAVESISGNTAEQDRVIGENEKAVKEYTDSLQRITDAARKAFELSTMSSTHTRDGRAKLLEIFDGMNKIRNSSDEIRNITGIINDISEQTNLLSLNASIEAARAGEHGRGFAVVAQEIGKLADRAISQAKSIQQYVNTTVADINRENETVTNSAGVMQQLERAVLDVNQAVSSILGLCESQVELSRNITNNMNLISKKSGETARSTEEQKLTIQEVTGSISVLSESMEGVIINTQKFHALLSDLQKQIEELRNITETSY